MGAMRLRPLLPAVLTLAVLAAACASGSDRPVPTFAPAANVGTAPLLPTNRYALPDFDPATFRELIAQLKGTPVLVNFWASWCGPCRLEAPFLAKASQTYGDRVQFVGIDVQDNLTSARLFIQEFHYTWPSVGDPQRAILSSLGLLSPPVTLFYAANGKLVSQWGGPLDARTLNARIQRIL